MNSSELLISPETLIRIFLFLLYAPVCLIVYWRLIPRLSPISKWIASGMLAAQVVLIVLSLEIRTGSEFEAWLWSLEKESNIPSVFASTQLALVGGLALITGWLARARPVWQRLYLVGVGLVFLYLGWDEFVDWKLATLNWKIHYIQFGVVLVVATMISAMRSPRRGWIWHFLLLAGLSLSAIGGFLLDDLPKACGTLGFFRIDGCLNVQKLEEVIEIMGGWLTLVAMLGQFSDAAPTLQARVRRILYALPVLWILLLTNHSFIPDIELRLLARPASVQFESEVVLQGYTIESAESEVRIRLFVAAHGWYYPGLGYSMHLVDQSSGQSIASRDEYADLRPVGRLLAPGGAHIYRQWMKVEIPPQTATNRALWLALTLWRDANGDFVRQKVLASDLQLLSETQVVLDEMVLPADSPAPSTVPVAVFDNGFTLDTVDMLENARPGEILSIPFAWRGDTSESEDLVQFLHFVNEENGTLWNHDQQPLGSRLPTRLWYRGLADTETWQVPLPADLEPGEYRVFTGLYRAGNQQRVPAVDADGTPFVDARVPLGVLTIEP